MGKLSGPRERWDSAREKMTQTPWECACCGVTDESGPALLVWRDFGAWDALCDVCAEYILRQAAIAIRGAAEAREGPE